MICIMYNLLINYEFLFFKLNEVNDFIIIFDLKFIFMNNEMFFNEDFFFAMIIRIIFAIAFDNKKNLLIILINFIIKNVMIKIISKIINKIILIKSFD